MMQPATTSGAVAKPNSSAPSSAATTTSRPVFSWPSTCTTIRSRRPLSSSVCCVSASPSSHGAPACFMRGQRRGAGAAVVAGDQHDVGVRLRDARRDRADAVLGDELDVHARTGVGVLQVVDQLRQILDRVDVVVRRRRDQPDARRRVTHLGDPRVHLVARQLAALTGFRALGHLDLDVGAVGQVVAGHAEPARRDLLDRAAAPVAVGVGVEAVDAPRRPRPSCDRPPRRFIAIASVSCASARDRAVTHCAGGESLDDLRRPARPPRSAPADGSRRGT